MALIDTAVIGKKGGEARAANMTPKQRSAAASAAALARWATYRAAKKAGTKKGGKK